jgi:hypothetical protein
MAMLQEAPRSLFGLRNRDISSRNGTLVYLEDYRHKKPTNHSRAYEETIVFNALDNVIKKESFKDRFIFDALITEPEDIQWVNDRQAMERGLVAPLKPLRRHSPIADYPAFSLDKQRRETLA